MTPAMTGATRWEDIEVRTAEICVIGRMTIDGTRYELSFTPSDDEKKNNQRLKTLLFAMHRTADAIADGSYPEKVSMAGSKEWPRTILEFDGPPTAYCFGRRYETLTSVGIKREGQPYPNDGADTKEAAQEMFERELVAYKHGAEQIAWRERANAIELGGKWFVTCRLVAYP